MANARDDAASPVHGLKQPATESIARAQKRVPPHADRRDRRACRMNYGQFCPIAKAIEILGERWNILIVRELLMGGRRFNELQRGLGDISPALLTSRLKSLEDQ